MPSIAVIGSLNVDFITTTSRVPEGGETLTATSFDTGFGGKGANQAVACARLSAGSGDRPSDDDSVKTSMVGAVGSDSFGSDFVSALAKEGIDTSHIRQIGDQKTGIANIIVEEGTGENRILLARNANHASGDEMLDLIPDEVDVVVFQLEIPLNLVLHNIRLAKSRGKHVRPLQHSLVINCLDINADKDTGDTQSSTCRPSSRGHIPRHRLSNHERIRASNPQSRTRCINN